jgi:MATE family multidrug resistance protein
LFYGIFILVLASLPLNSIAFTFDSLFKGLGEMGFLRNVLLASTFLGFVPVLYASIYFGWGLTGIWIAFLVWVAFRGLALWIKFRRKYYKLARTEKPPLK